MRLGSGATFFESAPVAIFTACRHVGFLRGEEPQLLDQSFDPIFASYHRARISKRSTPVTMVFLKATVIK